MCVFSQAIEFGYDVEIVEPDTAWRFKVAELTKWVGVATDAYSTIIVRYMIVPWIIQNVPDAISEGSSVIETMLVACPQAANIVIWRHSWLHV